MPAAASKTAAVNKVLLNINLIPLHVEHTLPAVSNGS
jgi:hypothetical protein